MANHSSERTSERHTGRYFKDQKSRVIKRKTAKSWQ